MISALSKRSLLLFLSLALTLFSALLIPPASALTPAEVSLDVSIRSSRKAPKIPFLPAKTLPILFL